MSDRAVVATLEGEPLHAEFPMYATVFGKSCVILPEARYTALVERERLAELDARAASAPFDQASRERQREALDRVAMVQEVERLMQEMTPAEAVAGVAQRHGVTASMIRRYRARVAGRPQSEWPSALLTRKGPVAAAMARQGTGQPGRT